MAKDKDTGKYDHEVIAEQKVKIVEQEEQIKALQQQLAANTNGRVAELEDWLVKLLPELHRIRINLPDGSLKRDFNNHFIKTRELLGAVGDSIDAQLRG